MKQRTRLSIAALATTAAAGTAGALLLPSAASARPVTHTLAFTSVQQDQTTFSPTVSGAEDKDVNSAGRVIGYDILRFVSDPKHDAASVDVAVNLNGGILYGVMHEGSGQTIHGTVTGGTGTFHGASGTITARPLDQDGARTAVTITYRS